MFFKKLLPQIFLLALLGLFFWSIWGNLNQNLALQGRELGLGFLRFASGFSILFHIFPYDASNSILYLFFIGLTNTLFVSVMGIIFSTIIGFLIGILGLSQNLLARFSARCYVEIFRNSPVLLQILFWYTLGIQVLPSVRNSIKFMDCIYINNRGMFFPRIEINSLLYIVFLIFAGSILTYVCYKFLKQRFQKYIYLILLIVIVLELWYIVQQIDIQIPVLGKFNIQSGTASVLPPELLTLIVALVIYTSAFIAEIVRAGFSAVPVGQIEASRSLGLNAWQTISLILIPQAMRVILPLLTNEYLNITKNSSLGITIGFPDLVAVFAGTALNQTGNEIEIILITMASYLFFSISISFIMQYFNARINRFSVA